MNSISRFKNQRRGRGGRRISLSFAAGVIVLAALGWFGIRSFTTAASEIGFLQGASEADLIASFEKQQELEEQVRERRPTPKGEREEFFLSASSGVSVFLEGDKIKTLFSQSADKQVPIASLTKLMVALVVLEQYDQDQVVAVSEEAVAEEGEGGFLSPGDSFKVGQLLYPLLIESSNDAASALAEVISRETFVSLMNKKAQELGLTQTLFVNPTGLDPDTEEGPINLSSARDVATTAQVMFQKYPEAFSILGLKEYSIKDARGRFHHEAQTTNELLGNQEWPTRVLGGKTGWTPEAGGCLFLALQGPKERGTLFTVVLGATDRFKETKRLADWVYASYLW